MKKPRLVSINNAKEAALKTHDALTLDIDRILSKIGGAASKGEKSIVMRAYAIEPYVSLLESKGFKLEREFNGFKCTGTTHYLISWEEAFKEIRQ